MLHRVVASESRVSMSGRRPLRRRLLGTAAAASVLGAGVLVGVTAGLDRPSFTVGEVAPVATDKVVVATSAAPELGFMLDPRPALGPGSLKVWSSHPLPATLRLASAPPPAVSPATPLRVASAEPAAAPAKEPARPMPISAPEPVRAGEAVPLPVPRPAELRPAPASPGPRLAARQGSRRTRQAALQAPAADNRNFFEKLFGLPGASAPAVNYAALDSRPLPAAPAPRFTPAPFASGTAGAAIYDISARTVTLPNGERLEAHSGLGEKLDDPRYAHVRMRGVTPPGTYDLTEREQLFHGVRALRLNPVGGSGAVHGRAGLLAHTFMLGPNGDSNGCVSFRDYERFLQAYLRGEVRRLVVVAGNAGPSGFFNRRFGDAQRPGDTGRGA